MTDSPHHVLPFSPDRFTDVLVRCQRPLYIFVYGMLGEEEQTRDLMQDTFCAAWRVAQRGLPPFDGASDESGMRRWLFHIAYNQSISALRRQRLIQWLPLETITLTLSFEDQVADGQAVRTALAALTPIDAAYLLLVIVQGFTVAEASQIIGSTPQAAARRFTRAKERLRKAYLAQNPQPVPSETKVRS